MNIYQKVNAVMKEIEYLTKDDQVAFGTTKYKAISEEKVTTVVRNELVKQGIVILPIQQESTVMELMRTEKSVNQRADVHVRYRIQNIDDVNDFIEVESNGSGVDTQDKAVGKAMTYAYKYMLLRTFAIPTGEDPDKISSAEIDDKLSKEIEPRITKTQEDALRDMIKNHAIAKDTVIVVLKERGYSKLSEIKLKDYAEIVKELERELATQRKMGD